MEGEPHRHGQRSRRAQAAAPQWQGAALHYEHEAHKQADMIVEVDIHEYAYEHYSVCLLPADPQPALGQAGDGEDHQGSLVGQGARIATQLLAEPQ